MSDYKINKNNINEVLKKSKNIELRISKIQWIQSYKKSYLAPTQRTSVGYT